MNQQNIQNGTVTSPEGFSAGATFADIKAWKEKPFDLAILSSEIPCSSAAVFTTNKIKAAPVILCENRVERDKVHAVIANSGCANACTAEQGMADAELMASLVAEKLRLLPDDVLVCSTGVIGTHLPMDKIKRGISRIILTPDGGHDVAQAIMTTDTVPKEIAVAFEIDGKKVIIGGVAKGAGMIHPNMATMLSFLTTDADIEAEFLRESLKLASDISFNMITVDGDTSTNDTLLILANGAAGNETLHKGHTDADVFQSALNEVCIHLAKSIARDGEGSTKLIEVTVEGAHSIADARIAARTVVGSPLVKTAVYGSDPNWGRVIAAAGRSGAEVVESKITLYMNQLCLLRNGRPLPFDIAEAEELMNQSEVHFRLCLNLGNGSATAWGCDFTEEYIALNGDYTT
ncbi:MAG: bifunctional glutamate N-acetyltransferase/amino-acid acetyltransferase ArgJ [Chloroflexota bacterium]|nr:bifunctional glutamate N-acetyltransferase/amino-acid acetyltransferase ArgJ [Chloroflexota bacterium]